MDRGAIWVVAIPRQVGEGWRMAKALHHERAELVARLRAVASLFCGLDYDGTLAPLAPTPAAAVPYPGTEAVLRRLLRRPGVRVAIVTGRPIADVQGFLNLPEAYYVGIHGLELKRPGVSVDYSNAGRRVRAVLPEIAERLRRHIHGSPGLLIEDKGAALALHYRLASIGDAERGRAIVEDAVAELIRRGEPLDLLYGHEVVEVRPRGVDKGKALCELLVNDAADARALYIGDDQTDEDAFVALPADAVTIRVGPRDVETAAAYQVDGPAEVHALLAELAGP